MMSIVVKKDKKEIRKNLLNKSRAKFLLVFQVSLKRDALKSVTKCHLGKEEVGMTCKFQKSL